MSDFFLFRRNIPKTVAETTRPKSRNNFLVDRFRFTFLSNRSQDKPRLLNYIYNTVLCMRFSFKLLRYKLIVIATEGKNEKLRHKDPDYFF